MRLDSRTTTSLPSPRSAIAAAKPAKPAPTTMARKGAACPLAPLDWPLVCDMFRRGCCDVVRAVLNEVSLRSEEISPNWCPSLQQPRSAEVGAGRWRCTNLVIRRQVDAACATQEYASTLAAYADAVASIIMPAFTHRIWVPMASFKNHLCTRYMRIRVMQIQNRLWTATKMNVAI